MMVWSWRWSRRRAVRARAAATQVWHAWQCIKRRPPTAANCWHHEPLAPIGTVLMELNGRSWSDPSCPLPPLTDTAELALDERRGSGEGGAARRLASAIVQDEYRRRDGRRGQVREGRGWRVPLPRPLLHWPSCGLR